MVLSEDQEVSRVTINLETARISWKDLEVLYMDVLMLRSHGCERAAPQHYQKLLSTEVALQIIKDNAKSLKNWMTKGKIDTVTDDQAKQYADTQTSVWAVVIKPWILIQSAAK